MRRVLAAVACLVALAACSGGAQQQEKGGAGADLTFAVVTHAGPGDTFWDVVKNGAEAAGEQYGVAVTYQGHGEPAQQSQLIDQAVSQKVDGLVVSMANPDALKEAIGKAVAAGIPVITINSGVDKYQEFGAITHVGQSEDVAGRGAGEQLKEAGVTRLLCVIHEAGNVGLDQRCTGAEETVGGTTERLQVDVGNVADASAKIKAKLQADKAVDGVLTLNPVVAIAARDAIKEAGSDVTLATFDLSEDVVNAIQAGEILFAVDQQQYLQGYLPVSFLYLQATNLNTVGGGEPVLTGPGYVTEENAAQVEKLASNGTR